MPNWVRNIVIPKKPEAFKAKVSTENEAIDFNNIIKMPDSLSITSPSPWESDGAFSNVSEFQKNAVEPIFKRLILLSNDVDEFIAKGKDIFERLGMTEEVRQHYRIDADDAQHEFHPYDHLFKAYYNKQKYGSTDWYDWCCNNWGTKWNACDTEWYGNELQFDTAWSCPESIYKELAKEFDFVAFFSDEDLGSNMGVVVAEDGDINYDLFIEESSMVRRALADLIHGDDCEDYEYEKDEGYPYPSEDDIHRAHELYNKYL